MKELLEKMQILEQKYDFQEKIIEELSQQLALLNKKNIEQEAKIKQIIDFIKQSKAEDEFKNEKPPHY